MIDRLSAAALDLLGSDAVATVATLNRDGSPHLSLAWVGIEDSEVVFGTLNDQRKLHNLRRDPRIGLAIQSERINEWGLREYLVLDGTARITEGGAPVLLQRLARTYLGPDVVFPAMPNRRPASWSGSGPTASRAWATGGGEAGDGSGSSWGARSSRRMRSRCGSKVPTPASPNTVRGGAAAPPRGSPWAGSNRTSDSPFGIGVIA